MCNAIGVDPLAASNVKGRKGEGGSFWTQMLGGDVNDFYFEVAVRVVELCRETRGENGGLIGVQECRERVAKGKGIGGDLKVSEYENDYLYRRITIEAHDLPVMTYFVPSNPSNHLDQASL